LVEGDFDQETVYGDDPVAVALSFAQAGAGWIHVVDLDAARTGSPVNRDVVIAIAAAVVSAGVRVQTGGGVRTFDDAANLLEGGVERVVIGTAAVERPELVAEVAARWPNRVAVGLDHRDGEVRLRGWAEGAGRLVDDLVPEVVEAGASAVIVTDIGRDGRLAGPDVSGLRRLLERSGAPIIASGGVSGMEDIRRLAEIGEPQSGLLGVIAGKAIYERRLDVVEAIRWLDTRERP
jgi:phosphoribosylformimino-5-aminoimidazole carboxamide ribotide isomerase